ASAGAGNPVTAIEPSTGVKLRTLVFPAGYQGQLLSMAVVPGAPERLLIDWGRQFVVFDGVKPGIVTPKLNGFTSLVFAASDTFVGYYSGATLASYHLFPDGRIEARAAITPDVRAE